MMKYLMMVCAAVALVGCAGDRGGVDDSSSTQTGSETIQSSSTNSSSITNSSTTTNSTTGNQGNNSGAQTPTTQDGSSTTPAQQR